MLILCHCGKVPIGEVLIEGEWSPACFDHAAAAVSRGRCFSEGFSVGFVLTNAGEKMVEAGQILRDIAREMVEDHGADIVDGVGRFLARAPMVDPAYAAHVQSSVDKFRAEELTCKRCGSAKPAGQSCGCFDNGCQ